MILDKVDEMRFGNELRFLTRLSKLLSKEEKLYYQS